MSWVGGISDMVPENPAVSSTLPTPTGFLQPGVMGIYLPGTGTLGWVVWCGAGIPRSQDITLFYNHCTWVWDQLVQRLRVSASPPLLPVQMNVVSLIPSLSDSHTARFSDSSE